VLVYGGARRCEDHKPAPWAKKADAVKRISGRRLQKMRAELFSSKPLCARCEGLGRVRLATQRDHIQSLEEGGLDVPENTQGLCDDCHDEKSLGERLRAVRRGRPL
jgi:5-methylcytosine-specific restriction protein A